MEQLSQTYPVDPVSGWLTDAGGGVVNVVDLLGGGRAVDTANPANYPAYPLSIVSSDGSVVNLADLLKNSARAMAVFPEPGAGNLGWIIQYAGESTDQLTHGYFYECVKTDDLYQWIPIDFGEVPVAAWSGENLVIT